MLSHLRSCPLGFAQRLATTCPSTILASSQSPSRRWLHVLQSAEHRKTQRSSCGNFASAARRHKSGDSAPVVSKYKAAILEEYDQPMVLANISNDSPLGTDMIKVAVHYCSLNVTDVNNLKRRPDSDDDLLPIIPGCEFAGEVLEVGDYVTENLHKGDKVVALLAADHQLGGGLAQQSVVSELDCFATGDVTLKDAAVLINGHGTAYLAFTKYCELQENDAVIVIAGPGGNGLAAIQLAKNVFKAKVYVVCNTDNTSSVMRDEGAHKVISIAEGLGKVYKFLEASLKEKKAKCVYDAVGGGLMYLAADFVDPKEGSFLSADPSYSYDTFSASKPEFKRTSAPTDSDPDAFVNKVKKVDLYKYRDFDKDFYRQTINDVLQLCAEEVIVPYTSREFGLGEVNEAVEFVRSKKCTGKVLVDVRNVTQQTDGDDDDDKKKPKKDD